MWIDFKIRREAFCIVQLFLFVAEARLDPFFPTSVLLTIRIFAWHKESGGGPIVAAVAFLTTDHTDHTDHTDESQCVYLQNP